MSERIAGAGAMSEQQREARGLSDQREQPTSSGLSLSLGLGLGLGSCSCSCSCSSSGSSYELGQAHARRLSFTPTPQFALGSAVKR